MPQAVVPALLAGVTAGSAFTLTAGLTIGFSTTAFVSSLVLSAASQALAPKPKIPNIGGGGNGGIDQSKTVTARQSNATRKLVYGETRTGGTFAFLESTDSDQYLHVVIVVAAHEVEQFTGVYFNDELLTLTSNSVTSPAKYDGFADVYTVVKGAAGNIPAPLLATASWTSDHKLTDQAYIYCRLKFDPNAFPLGLPNISAAVQGRKIYDTRTSSTVFSRNPAMIIRDYLLDETYGLGVTAAEIDDTSFEAAANICDENVALSGGGTETRYQFDGVVDTANTPRGNLEQMLTALNGALYYTNGKWNLKAGAYVTPTVTLDEDDLAAGLTVTTSNSARDSFNAIKGQFISPDSDYQATDYPAVTSATFETEDNSEQRFLNLDLPFTSSASAAQRIAKQILYKNRQEIAVKARFKMTAFQFQVGDTVMITNSRLGFSQKVFEVITWRLNFDQEQATVDCELAETNSAVYAWAAEETAFQQDNTTLPNPFNIPAPSLTVSEELELFNEQAISVLIIDVTSTSIYARQFEVEAKLSTESDYKSLGISTGSRFTSVNVKKGGTYNVRARSNNALGIKSAYATANYAVVGKSAVPSDVTDLSVNVVNAEAHLTWTAVSDQDLSHYIVRHSALTSGANYNDTQTVMKKVPRPASAVVLPALTGTYFIKAVDKFGFESANADSSIVLISALDVEEVYASLTEHPLFAGTKTNTAATGEGLQLTSSTLFDDLAGNFDDAAGLFDLAGGTLATSGSYLFENYVDLGYVLTAQLVANLQIAKVVYSGSTPDVGGTEVDLFVSTTQDDPAGSPVWGDYRPFNVGRMTARAFRFKLELSTQNNLETPSVQQAQILFNVDQKTYFGNDITSGSASKVVTYAKPFSIFGGISVAVGDMQSGDYYVITSKTTTGFTITFYNSSDAAISRVFDYVAVGY